MKTNSDKIFEVNMLVCLFVVFRLSSKKEDDEKRKLNKRGKNKLHTHVREAFDMNKKNIVEHIFYLVKYKLIFKKI